MTLDAPYIKHRNTFLPNITKSEGDPMSYINTHSTACRPMRRLSLLTLVERLAGLWRSRTALAELDDHLLEDIGLTPREAAREARKALWDVPSHWTR
jgi:uncharacterized protein YjiS (DUF1127 family)